MTISRIDDSYLYNTQLQQQKTQSESVSNTDTSYRFTPPLRTLTPHEYGNLYTHNDVSANGVVAKRSNTQPLEDIKISDITEQSSVTKAADVTDTQMDEFLRKAFRVFDFE